MDRGRTFWERLADDVDLASEPLPGQPIVELAGERRVLIENHLGVKAYSRESILVKVKFGCICVCGSGLELTRMTREQLLIRGKRKITLTEEGMILRKRAEEIMELVRKAESEIALSDEYVAGDITVGAAETDGVRFLVQRAQAHPDIFDVE